MRGERPPGFDKLFDGTSWDGVASTVDGARWAVSPNPRHRTKKEKERWILARFLLAPETQTLLRLPLTVYEGDRPDFWIVTNGKTIGVEVSEIVHEIEAEARTIAWDNDLEVYFPPHPNDFPTRQARKKLQETILTGGRPWLGSEPELSFAKLTCSLIAEKSKKQQHYAASDASFLLLYSNTGAPLCDRTFGSCGARDQIAAFAEARRDQFEHVAIWMGQKLIVF